MKSVQYATLIHCTKLEKLALEKRSILLAPFVCYEENEVLSILLLLEPIKYTEHRLILPRFKTEFKNKSISDFNQL
jgi:hypothetical protein